MESISNFNDSNESLEFKEISESNSSQNANINNILAALTELKKINPLAVKEALHNNRELSDLFTESPLELDGMAQECQEWIKSMKSNIYHSDPTDPQFLQRLRDSPEKRLISLCRGKLIKDTTLPIPYLDISFYDKIKDLPAPQYVYNENNTGKFIAIVDSDVIFRTPNVLSILNLIKLGDDEAQCNNLTTFDIDRIFHNLSKL